MKVFLKNLLRGVAFVLFIVILDGIDLYTKLFNLFTVSTSGLAGLFYNNPLYCLGIIILLLVIFILAIVLNWQSILSILRDGRLNKWDSFASKCPSNSLRSLCNVDRLVYMHSRIQL